MSVSRRGLLASTSSSLSPIPIPIPCPSLRGRFRMKEREEMWQKIEELARLNPQVREALLSLPRAQAGEASHGAE